MTSPTCVITVGTSILFEPPIEADTPDFHFAPSETESKTLSNLNTWGGVSPVYVCFKVRDTGCGLAS